MSAGRTSRVTCDLAIAGGAEAARQYLAAGHVDLLRLHLAPVLLGAGERLLDGVGDLALEPLRSAAPASSPT